MNILADSAAIIFIHVSSPADKYLQQRRQRKNLKNWVFCFSTKELGAHLVHMSISIIWGHDLIH